MKITLIFNKKFVDSKLMCQSTEIEINSFENKNVVFFNFFRKCRHCKQFFIFEIFFINIFHTATKISKNWNMLKNWKVFKKDYSIENLYELHVCFHMKWTRWKKIFTQNTCDIQIFMQKTHIRNTRRRKKIFCKSNDKKYLLWTHATLKYLYKKCIFEILVVEASN